MLVNVAGKPDVRVILSIFSAANFVDDLILSALENSDRL